MRKPPLTKKVARGLRHVEGHARAVLESMKSDESGTYDPRALEDMDTALTWIRQIVYWHDGLGDGREDR